MLKDIALEELDEIAGGSPCYRQTPGPKMSNDAWYRFTHPSNDRGRQQLAAWHTRMQAANATGDCTVTPGRPLARPGRAGEFERLF